jgi:hypothetical protein
MKASTTTPTVHRRSGSKTIQSAPPAVSINARLLAAHQTRFRGDFSKLKFTSHGTKLRLNCMRLNRIPCACIHVIELVTCGTTSISILLRTRYTYTWFRVRNLVSYSLPLLIRCMFNRIVVKCT